MLLPEEIHCVGFVSGLDMKYSMLVGFETGLIAFA